VPKLTIQNEGRTIEVEANANIRDAIKKAGGHMHGGLSSIFNCRGHGLCGTCEVLVIEGADNLTERTPKEFKKIHTNDRCRRLACQTSIIGDAHVVVNSDRS
jgi:ferredoxin